MRSTGKIRRLGIAVAVVAIAGVLAATPALADQTRLQIPRPFAPAAPQQPRLQIWQPNPHIAPPHQPRLGLYGHMEYGRGMVVDYIPWGTPASRTGLEPGDVIVRINGRWIRSDRDYFLALRTTGPYCRLLVNDVRGRGLIPVLCHLEMGHGPILYRSQSP